MTEIETSVVLTNPDPTETAGNNRKITVSGCGDCPFACCTPWMGDHACSLGRTPDTGRLMLYEDQWMGRAPLPQDCELRRCGIRVAMYSTKPLSQAGPSTTTSRSRRSES